jgi:hypothetical protein
LIFVVCEGGYHSPPSINESHTEATLVPCVEERDFMRNGEEDWGGRRGIYVLLEGGKLHIKSMSYTCSTSITPPYKLCEKGGKGHVKTLCLGKGEGI